MIINIKPEVLDFVENVRPHILGNQSHPYQTLLICDTVKDIEGDFVECGVAYGGTAGVMGKYLQSIDSKKRLHLFDSFEGIPYPTEKDGVPIDGKQFPKTGELISTGISSCSLNQVRYNMDKWEIPQKMLMYYKGWLENSLPICSKSIDKIAFLRIDVDLYRPTLLCLRYLYDKVSSGGYIMVHDDEKALAGPRKAVADFIKNKRKGIKIGHFPDGGGLYWRKP